MLLLFETAAGHALYELKHEDKLKKLDADKLASKLSEDPRKALSLKTFAPFRDTTEAVAAASDFVESKLNKQLKKFLKKQVPNGGVELGVADPKLGALIKEKLNIPCVASSFVNECLRGARSLAIDGDSSVADAHDVRAMQLGLSHSHIGDSGDAQLGQCLLFEGPHAAGDVAGLVTVRVWISGACLAEGLRKDAEWWVPRYAIAFAGTSQPDEECIYGVPDPTSDLWSLANYAAAEEPSATTGMILTPTLTQPSKP